MLADVANAADEFDAVGLGARIDEKQQGLGTDAGADLDRAIKFPNDYGSLHVALNPATAF